ncbi:FlgB family protein [Yoonia sp. 208BN28-4]|uniref:FlgB family protein n=1 Tax=Yoonia sp. 208BN28-4 TaxID=3126505 RepID=UPI00309B113E
MYQSLAIFETAGKMAQHAGARQAVVARNVANADTPGFQAMHMARFSESYQAAPQMRATRPLHALTAPSGASTATAQVAQTEMSPNGNSVSVEDEMLSAVDASREHSRALAIYKHTMTVLRTTIRR